MRHFGLGMGLMGTVLAATIGRNSTHVFELKDRPGPAPEAKSRRVREAPPPNGSHYAPVNEAESRQVRRARERRASKLFERGRR